MTHEWGCFSLTEILKLPKEKGFTLLLIGMGQFWPAPKLDPRKQAACGKVNQTTYNQSLLMAVRIFFFHKVYKTYDHVNTLLGSLPGP